jgi:hypothetical protein
MAINGETIGIDWTVVEKKIWRALFTCSHELAFAFV